MANALAPTVDTLRPSARLGNNGTGMGCPTCKAFINFGTLAHSAPWLENKTIKTLLSAQIKTYDSSIYSYNLRRKLAYDKDNLMDAYWKKQYESSSHSLAHKVDV